MAGIQQVPMSDFTGGFTPKLASTDFSDRQWARLEGLVLEGEKELRSQWACQQIGTLDEVVWVVPYQGHSRLYLVALAMSSSFGSLWYCEIPATSATSATTGALVWTQITGQTNGVSPEGRRPAGLIPVKAASTEGFRSALLLVKDPGPDPDANGVNTSAMAIYQTDGATTLSFTEYTDPYPANDSEGVPVTGKMPRAMYGIMWEDYLILGSIEWYVDGSLALSESNVMPFQNGLWFSEGGDPFAFDPQSVVFVGDPETNITGLAVIDAGLMVFTSSGPFDTGGVYLLRGDPANFEIEVLSSVGADQGAAKWNHTGAAAWVTETGEILHSNGEGVLQLDEPLDLDRTTTTADCVCGFGPYLLASRNGGLYAFRVFEEDGAWTQLVTPGGRRVRRVVSLGDQAFMVVETGSGWGEVWRFVRPENAERGHIAGTAIDSYVATRTVESGGGHDVTFWHRFGLRARGPGTIKTVTLRPGPALDAAQPTHVVTLSRALTDRDEIVVPAHGPSVEASAEIVFNGDVRVEQTALWAHKGRGSR